MLIRRDVGAACQAARLGVVVLALATVVACDKVPLGAPTNSTITMNSATRSIPMGGSAEITAFVLEGSGTPVQNGTSVRFTTNLGTVEPADALTINGVATTTLRAGSVSGVAQVRANSGAAGGGTGNTNLIEISIGSAGAAGVTLSASSLVVPTNGGTVTLTATVVDGAGNRVPGASVNFTTTAGTLSAVAPATNASGEATVQLTTDRNATVTARVGIGDGARTGTVTITAQSTTLALATAPAAPTVGQVVSLTVTPTIATGAAVPRVSVNWGDGTTEDLGFVSGARTVTHIYGSAGTFTVSSSATTGSDVTTSTTSVIVTQRPVIGVNVGVTPASPAANTTVTLTATVTPAADAANVLRYEWQVANADTGAQLFTQTTTGNELRFVVTGGVTYSVRVTATTTDGRVGVGLAQFRSP